MDKTKKYYVGLDIGTDSVGYAVTDANYNVLKFNGKAMWGVRLFEQAQVAAQRRVFRNTRRRLERRRQRIELLQELFAEEISKVDMGFYQRVKDSMLYPEDKCERQKYSLFNDGTYSDVDFYKEFPTIYHLRKALITEDKKFDIRLVYIALHHLIKHRGHFLFDGTMESITSFSDTFQRFTSCMKDELDIDIVCLSEKEVADIIKEKKLSKRDKVNKLAELLLCDKNAKQLKAIIGLMCGNTVKLADVFNDDALEDIEKSKLSFATGSYDEIRPELEADLQERCVVIDVIKNIYDWGVLADILKGGEYNNESFLSVAKVGIYEKHRADLGILKRIIKENDEEFYKEFFKKKGDTNYAAYIGYTIRSAGKENVKKCTDYEAFAKTIKSFLDKRVAADNPDAIRIKEELDNKTFLPLQVTKDNGVIPHQINEIELKRILENVSRYYGFLNEKDEFGISVKEKIVKIFEYRVPYYVGPLNTYNSKNAWAVRKEPGKITPWNIEEKIDFDKSGEAFIRRMTNKCTYLVGKDVLPKNSLLYCEFMVWNEINNIRIGAEKPPVELKKTLFETVFKKRKKVSCKNIIDFLHSEGMEFAPEDLNGIDNNIKAALVSYHDFRRIFGDDIEKYSVRKMVEELILWITLYGDEVKMLKRIIRKNYNEEQITDEQLKQICRIHYQGWGRLSSEFLCELEGCDVEVGEKYNIITALRETNDNLMQLLSSRYTFYDNMVLQNKKDKKEIATFTYESVMEDVIASPAIKRSIWQTILIIQEIKKIMGHEPDKIFVEVAREEGKKERTVSRKDRLLELYKSIKNDKKMLAELGVTNHAELTEVLINKNESDLRSIKLYLYYTQMGRCMYSGEPIDLSELYNANVYDRDHIYPQSLTKDDSLDNLVLVKRNINAKKSNDVLSPEIQKNMSSFWKYLRDKKFISDKKYERLMRPTPLTDEELAGFINRQLVETRQSTKIVAQLLEEICNDSKIVYVKAGRVSEFRNDPRVDAVKSRSVNDYHHAKDAYLNIVVGNVYYEKFTNNPLKWLKGTANRNYSLNRMFDFELRKGDELIWIPGENGTLSTVKKFLGRNNIQYTRYATTNKSGQNGGFFNQMPVGKSDNAGVPLKQGLDVNKYGGYKSLTPAYFALVESKDKKGKVIRSIEAVPLYLAEEFNNNPTSFLEYCENKYELIEPKVIIPKIKKDTCIVIEGFSMHLRGTNGRHLILQCGIQLVLDKKKEQYVKKIEKYIVANTARKDKKNLLPITEYDGITVEQNYELYDELYLKMRDGVYSNRPANQYAFLEKSRMIFGELSLEEQCLVLNEIMHLLQCKPLTANFTMLKGGANAGSIKVNKIVTNASSAIIKNQSVTGLFEQEIDLLKI